ncbi:MAG: YihY/virulence factor BrkB family protein [Marmoricola sp.]
MTVSQRLDRLQQRVPVLGFPIGCFYKFFDDFGNYLAALLTYYALVSILPLLLLGSTILSVVLVGHPHLQQQLLDTALAQFPVLGDQLKAPEAFSGGTVAVVVGLAGASYGALGVAQALQYAGNTIWHVPRNSRPNPFLARGRSVVLVLTAGLALLIATIGLAVLHGTVRSGTVSGVLIFVGGLVISTVVLMVAFQLAPNRRLSIGELLPGALIAALVLQLLQNFSYVYVAQVIQKASATNAVFATVLGLLAYLYLLAVTVVFCMEVNVVRAERLWPRALLTPFTDNVELTAADVEAYAGQAKAQRAKGFEEIQVSFDDRAENESQ